MVDALPGVAWESTTPVAQAAKYAAAIGVGVVATVLVEKPALRLRERLVPTDGTERTDRRTATARA